jgi:hypothetical protein
MNLQHINVKLLVANPEAVNLGAVVPVFHSWIQDRVCDELLLDVADYRHVHQGPGVVLIGHEADYSLDNADGELGIRYNRKATFESAADGEGMRGEAGSNGSAQWRMEQAARAALLACRRLETDPRLEGSIRFDGRHLKLFVNDRLLAPNSDATREAIAPDFEAFAAKLFGGRAYSIRQERDPRRLFSIAIETSSEFTTDELLKNLAS